MSLSKFAVDSPVKVTMIFIAILMLGYIALTRLPTNLFPDIRAPKVTVTVKTKGLSPAEVERRICESLERSLYTIRGVQAVQTIARADSAVVITTFEWSASLDFAFIEVKKATSDLQRENATDIESVNVLQYDPNAKPVMTVALQGPEGTDLESLRRSAEQSLKPRFERIEGVANAVLTGGVKREILIALDESKLLTYDLNVSNVVSALQADNVDSGGGWVEEGARRYLLKSIGQFEDIEQVRRVTVGRKGDVPIALEDVASVEETPEEAKSVVYYDGRPAVGMAFYREADSNTVAVAKAIREEMELVNAQLQTGWKITVANDQSTFISDAISEVKKSAFFGGLLAVAVLIAFLRDIRTTAIIAIAIPVSIVATFNLMYFQGLTLNLMSLGGLALGSGMLVDNAIVILENIFRLRQIGYSAVDAAIEGTKEVSGAIIASTLTTVAVFFPITYMQGVASLLFREQALTVGYSQVTSLFAALLLIPMMAARFLGKLPKSFQPEEDTDEIPPNLYTKMLRVALRFRGTVLVVGGIGMTLSIIALAETPKEFLPATEVRQFGIRLVLPAGTPIAATDEVVKTILGQLDRYKPAMEPVFARVGEPEGVVNANDEDPDGPNTADLWVNLHDADNPTTAALAAGLGGLTSSRLIADLKPVLALIPDAKVEFSTSQGSLMELLGTSQAPLLIELSGQDLDQLTALVGQMQQRLETEPKLLNVRTNILQGSPEILMKLDPAQLGKYGLDISSVTQILKQRIDGEVATTMRRDAGDVDLRVKVDYGRESLETVKNITFKASTGAVVRLAQVADFTEVRGPREIVRKRQQRVAYVMADLAEGVKLSDGISLAEKSLSDMRFPSGYTVRYTGEEEQRRAAFGDLSFALILSIFLVYMVMASIFESFLQPLIILFTIPMSAVGIWLGLVVSGQTLNVMSIIGIVMLGGIVVNNAIVLLDCVNQVRQRISTRMRGAGERSSFLFRLPKDMERDTLIIGSNQRLRPVFMTTLTTVLGLLPMALGIGEGAELQQAMAVTVFGGMLSSTLLTLFIIPCCQSYLDTFLGMFSRAVMRSREAVRKIPATQQ